MNVNTALWGDPSTIWFHKQSAPNVTTNCVISEMRVGATSWNDNDFDNYPATKFCRDICLFGYWRDGWLTFDGESLLDNSLSYTAIANADLPQMDIRVATVGTQADWANNALMQSNPTEPVPFSLATYRDYGQTYNPFYRSQIYGIDGFNNNAALYATQGMQRWCPFGLVDSGSSIGNTQWGKYNPNGRLGMIGEFGIKSIILELHVRYYDGGYYETSTSTFKGYKNHTLEWRLQHPILSVYAVPYYRINKNGTYSSGLPLGYTADSQMVGLSPVFYRTLYSNATSRTYTSYLMGGHGALSGGYFPIYGAVLSDSGYTSQWVTANGSYTDPSQTAMNNGVYFYGCQRGELVKSGTSFKLVLNGTDENLEWLKRGAAAYGMFFCEEIDTLGNSGRDSGDTERWIDPDMYCGVIAEDGMTYGDYTQGADNADNRVYNWSSSTQTPFDPSNIPDTDNTKYNYETHYPDWNLVPSTCNMYVVGQTAMERLSDIIATAIAQRPDPDQLSTVDYALNNGLTNNPIDTIISVRAYAAKSLPYSSLVPAEPIHCGAWWNNGIQGHRLSRTGDFIDYHFRRSTQNGLVAAYGNSFLDYAPYTRAELIIPYCGTVALQAADFMNHDINVRIIVDYITGMCTAFVMRDSVAIATVSGSLGVDIPVTGLQNATLAAQRVNAVLQRDNANMNTAGALAGTVVSAVGLAASAATGNVVGAIGAGAGLVSSINRLQQSDNQLIKADYDIQHMQAPVKSIQSATPNISFRYEHACRLIIYRPVLSSDYDPEIYGHTIGFACLINGKVKQFSGLTVGTIDTGGIVATDTEKTMIQKAFSTGVYL